MRKDEGDWYGKRPPPIDTVKGRVDLMGYGMVNVPPGGVTLHPRPKPSSSLQRFYGLLAFAAFVFAAAEVVQPPRDWTFIAVCSLAGMSFLTAWIIGRR